MLVAVIAESTIEKMERAIQEYYDQADAFELRFAGKVLLFVEATCDLSIEDLAFSVDVLDFVLAAAAVDS